MSDVARYLSFDVTEKPLWRGSASQTSSDMVEQIVTWANDFRDLRASKRAVSSAMASLVTSEAVQFVFHSNVLERVGTLELSDTEALCRSALDKAAWLGGPGDGGASTGAGAGAGSGYTVVGSTTAALAPSGPREYTLKEKETLGTCAALRYLHNARMDMRAACLEDKSPLGESLYLTVDLMNEVHALLLNGVSLSAGQLRKEGKNVKPRWVCSVSVLWGVWRCEPCRFCVCVCFP